MLISNLEQAFENVRKVGIKTYASLIYGLPFETEVDIRLTDELIKRIKPCFLGRNLFVGIPYSELYNIIKNRKMYSYEDQSGILYLKGHNEKVNFYYGGNPYMKIPGTVPVYQYKIKDIISTMKKILPDHINSSLSKHLNERLKKFRMN